MEAAKLCIDQSQREQDSVKHGEIMTKMNQDRLNITQNISDTHQMIEYPF